MMETKAGVNIFSFGLKNNVEAWRPDPLFDLLYQMKFEKSTFFIRNFNFLTFS